MEIPKIDLSVIGSAWSSISKGLQIIADLKTFWLFFREQENLIHLPFVNMLIAFKKMADGAHELALKNNTPIATPVSEWLDKAADGLLSFFHCRDDYDKLVALDKAVEPK